MDAQVVRLNVYDSDRQGASQFLLGLVGLGQHVSGIQVCNHEYTFTAADGIVKLKPLGMPRARINTAVALGKWSGSPKALGAILRDLEKDYAAATFDSASRNSNHFAA